ESHKLWLQTPSGISGACPLSTEYLSLRDRTELRSWACHDAFGQCLFQRFEQWMVLLLNVAQDCFGCFFVIGMGGAIAIGEHLHPTVTVANQAFAECLANGVAWPHDAIDTLPNQKVFQRVPAKFIAVFEALDDALLFQFRQIALLHELHCFVELLKRFAEVVEALLPAHIDSVH